MATAASASMIGSGDPAYVLYVDHQGHPAPLSECFHATASRRLSSTVDRMHRPSTVTQVDSAYCPQCLQFYDAPSATQLGYCPNPICVECPLCTSIVAVAKRGVAGFNAYSLLQKMEATSPAFLYDCGGCDWNSTHCNLKVDCDNANTPTKQEEKDALEVLDKQLQDKRQEGGHTKSAEEHYQKMVAAWEGIVKSTTNSGPKSTTSASSPTSRGLQFKKIREKPEEESWSVEALESAMETKKKEYADATTVVGEQPLQRISLEEEQTLGVELQDRSVESLALQALTNRPTTEMADLLPLQIPLRSRKSRRCRAELAEGKPGILLKPKLNPLEGDSSLRTVHGQWWKKDSSAVHVVPRVRVIRHGSKSVGDDNTTQQHAFVLKVTNSTLGLVRLQIGLSGYQGESFWDPAETTAEEAAEDQPSKEKNPAMENLLVETVSNKHVDAFLLTPPKQQQQTPPQFMSELVVLDSAEDTIVDIGKVFAVPDEVTNWNAEKVLADLPSSEGAVPEESKVAFTSIKKLAEKSGSAWFELICVTELKPIDDVFSAIPISLQIEVGNGSWESSLIKKTSEGDEPDMVSFDLVLTWPNGNSKEEETTKT